MKGLHARVDGFMLRVCVCVCVCGGVYGVWGCVCGFERCVLLWDNADCARTVSVVQVRAMGRNVYPNGFCPLPTWPPHTWSLSMQRQKNRKTEKMVDVGGRGGGRSDCASDSGRIIGM